LIFVGQKQNGRYTREWKLYNDTQVQDFRDWAEVVHYCISSKCIPTLLFYEALQPLAA
jgi:hypothetical protein